MLSSVSGIIGSIGQANYAAGNTYQDSLAKYRVLAGQKATSLALGWMGDVGIIAENKELARGKEAMQDMAQISEAEFHALLEYHCDPRLPLLSPMKAQPIVGLVAPAQFRAKGLEPPSWMENPMLAPLARMDLTGPSSSTAITDSAADSVDYAAKFAASPSVRAGEVVTEALVQKLAKAITFPPTGIDTAKPLHAYGVDSLLAVEIRNWFAKVFEADIAVFDIMGKGSIDAIGAVVAAKSALKRIE